MLSERPSNNLLYLMAVAPSLGAHSSLKTCSTAPSLALDDSYIAEGAVDELLGSEADDVAKRCALLIQLAIPL